MSLIDLKHPDVQELIRQEALRLIRAPLSTKPIIGSWDALLDYLQATLAHSPVELFHVLYLDRRNRLIHDETVATGTIDHVPVYPREIAKQALLRDASALILAHNHPSGDPSPSATDLSMTKSVHKALRAIEVTLHDHVIVGHGGQTYSFRSNGDL